MKVKIITDSASNMMSVTIISRLSGSYNAAMAAKMEYEEENPGNLSDKSLQNPQLFW